MSTTAHIPCVMLFALLEPSLIPESGSTQCLRHTKVTMQAHKTKGGVEDSETPQLEAQLHTPCLPLPQPRASGILSYASETKPHVSPQMTVQSLQHKPASASRQPAVLSCIQSAFSVNMTPNCSAATTNGDAPVRL